LKLHFYPGIFSVLISEQHLTMAQPFCAFDNSTQIAEGDLLTVALASKQHTMDHPDGLVVIFNCKTGHPVDVLLQGDSEQIRDWIQANIPSALPVNKTRGRPKLGVVSREVTLLPRQWAWLATQPGGASVTLRRLVDTATKDPIAEQRTAQDAIYRFANALAGNEPGFEEAIRALYQTNRIEFSESIETWPSDVKTRIQEMTDIAW
jgi:hypothetical protein